MEKDLEELTVKEKESHRKDKGYRRKPYNYKNKKNKESTSSNWATSTFIFYLYVFSTVLARSALVITSPTKLDSSTVFSYT